MIARRSLIGMIGGVLGAGPMLPSLAASVAGSTVAMGGAAAALGTASGSAGLARKSNELVVKLDLSDIEDVLRAHVAAMDEAMARTVATLPHAMRTDWPAATLNAAQACAATAAEMRSPRP